jgi:hypothetical protein
MSDVISQTPGLFRHVDPLLIEPSTLQSCEPNVARRVCKNIRWAFALS